MVVGGVSAAILAGALTSVIAPPSTRNIGANTCYTKCSTTTAASTSKASVALGSETGTKFTAKVTTTGTGTPSGHVTFTATGAASASLCSAVALSGGSASCTLTTGSELSKAGSYVIHAAYTPGTGAFAASTGTVGETVTSPPPTPTTTKVATSKPSIALGSETGTKFTATVTATGTVKPAGHVTFTATGPTSASLCSAVTTASGVATCTLSSGSQLSKAGAYLIHAAFTPSTSAFGSSNGQVGETVTSGPTPTTTKVATSATSITLGKETGTKFTATVSAGTVKPAGSVAFTAAGAATATLCAKVTVAAGVATCTLTTGSQLSKAGAYTIKAAFTPSTTAFSASSGTVAETVKPATSVATSTTLAAPKSAVIGGETAERFTATVKAATGTTKPAGTVAILSGTVTLCHATVVGGIGSCALSPTQLPIKSYSVTASYTPSTGFLASKSAIATFSIVKGTPASTFKMSATTVSHTAEATLKFTVTVKSPTGDTLFGTGAVTLVEGTKVLCTVHLLAANKGVGSCNLTNGELVKGAYTVSAKYPGDANFNAATSATQKLTVT
jgi:hypothetical protein